MLTYVDAILTPVYFALLLALLMLWKRKYYKHSPVGKYIIPCFVLKVICCVFLACIYHFYYGYSDSQTFFSGPREVWHATKASPIYGLELIFKPIDECSVEAQKFADQMANATHSLSTIYLFKIAGFIGLFCYGTYMPIALVFTLLAFIGTWRIFMVFYKEYPEHHKLLALACLFAPSTLLWGTNILKDPLCIFGLGLCITGFYRIMKGGFRAGNLVEMLAGSCIMLLLKDYIFYIFLITAILTLYQVLKHINHHLVLRNAIRVGVSLGVIIFLVWAYSNIQNIGDLLYENFTAKTEAIQNSQAALIDEGASGYIIPNVKDFSTWGIFRSYLLSLNVALFRPYLWEVRNPLMLLNALESTLVLLLTAWLLIRSKILGFFSLASRNPFLFFALIFTLFLAPLAGFVSFNFGTLVRYKFPTIPLFYTYLMVLYISLRKKQIDSNA